MARKPRFVPAGPASDEAVAVAEQALDHTFADPSLLRVALTHPSAVEGMSSLLSYERLEFLGDAVISFVVSEELYARLPQAPEGEMTRIKVAVVRGSTLSALADRLGLCAHMKELNLSERGLHSALENTFEAVVAALYLDAGIDVARSFVLRAMGDLLTEDASIPVHPKTRFLEEMAAHGHETAFRVVSEEGPSHARVFTVEALVDGAVVGTGSAPSKKEAETAASSDALSALSKPNEPGKKHSSRA